MNKEEIDDARMRFLWILSLIITVLIALIIGNDNYMIIAPLPLYIIPLSIFIRWRREIWDYLKYFGKAVIGKDSNEESLSPNE